MKVKSRFLIAALCFVLSLACCRKNESEQQFVGVTEFQFHYDAADREVTVDVWYPSKEQPGAKPHEFISGFSGKATLDALPDSEGAPYPLIVFSHGFQGTRFQSIFLVEALASAGYVVAAPDHPDSLVAEGGFKLSDATLYTQRPAEISFVIDKMTELNESDPILSGMIDLGHVGMTGHSLGGYTTLMVSGAQLDIPGIIEKCSTPPEPLGCFMANSFTPGAGVISGRDERVIASISLAPLSSVFTGDGINKLGIPHTVMGGTKDSVTPFPSEQGEAYDNLNPPKYLLEIKQGGHMTFSDLACRFMTNLVDCKDSDKKHKIILDYEIPFFDLYLKGKASAGSNLKSKETEDFKFSSSI